MGTYVGRYPYRVSIGYLLICRVFIGSRSVCAKSDTPDSTASLRKLSGYSGKC